MEVLASTQFQRFSKWGLKIPRWQHRAGSIPASGTTVFFSFAASNKQPALLNQDCGFFVVCVWSK
jgi:hypothetical protein